MESDRKAPGASPENLLTVVRQARDAQLVLPEFQRSFVWAREDIEEFLASILQHYFVGTFLILDTPSDKPMFPFRRVEGLETLDQQLQPNQYPTVRLVLDGQQRITSLFYALYSPSLPLRGSKYPHRFYLRLIEALGGNLDDAVIGVSTRDRRRMAEIDKLVKDQHALPLPLLRETGNFYKWLYREQKAWNEEEARLIDAVYQRFEKFMVPIVSLEANTHKDNIVNIFERINRTGVSLSLSDLAGARLYLKGVRLRDLWKSFEEDYKSVPSGLVKPESLLRVIALLEGKEPRRANLLDVVDELDADVFTARWNAAMIAMGAAYKRTKEYFGAVKTDLIPYPTMLVPLAAMVHKLRTASAEEKAYRKLDKWYWHSVFSQRYDSAVDTKSHQDVREVSRWIEEDNPPAWLKGFGPDDVDLNEDETRSAVYRGLMCLIARAGARDFLTGQPVNLYDAKDEHIFAQAVYRKSFPVDIVLNRTLISDKTNPWKNARLPSQVLPKFLSGHGNDMGRLFQTLSTHFISESAYNFLLKDDFPGFTEARRGTFKTEIARVLDG